MERMAEVALPHVLNDFCHAHLGKSANERTEKMREEQKEDAHSICENSVQLFGQEALQGRGAHRVRQVLPVAFCVLPALVPGHELLPALHRRAQVLQASAARVEDLAQEVALAAADAVAGKP